MKTKLFAKNIFQRHAGDFVTYFIVFGLILVIALFQGCKKDPSGNPGPGFSGCRMVNFEGEAITYTTDYKIARIGDILFNYSPGKVLVYDPEDPTMAFEVSLNSRNKCEKIKEYDPTDPQYSIEYSYTYDSFDQPVKCKLSAIDMADTLTYYEYYIFTWENQNLTKVQFKFTENGPVVAEQNLEYDLTLLEKRKDFFQRFYFGNIGTLDFPIGNNCNKNLLVKADGNPNVYYSYQYDSKGNITEEISRRTSGSDTTHYNYECH
ncbi:MAG: hypothetical protein Q8M15_17110 [Bacteroidota bacterium]|nr:hypothetical protein [Bacteroidota bacterium]